MANTTTGCQRDQQLLQPAHDPILAESSGGHPASSCALHRRTANVPVDVLVDAVGLPSLS